MASSISFELHLEALDRLCYVCGEIIMKNGHEITPTLHADMVETFTIHSHLQTEVSPKGICYTCFITVKNFLKKKSEGKCINTSKRALLWVPHSADCQTCELYSTNKKGIMLPMFGSSKVPNSEKRGGHNNRGRDSNNSVVWGWG